DRFGVAKPLFARAWRLQSQEPAGLAGACHTDRFRSRTLRRSSVRSRVFSDALSAKEPVGRRPMPRISRDRGPILEHLRIDHRTGYRPRRLCGAGATNIVEFSWLHAGAGGWEESG